MKLCLKEIQFYRDKDYQNNNQNTLLNWMTYTICGKRIILSLLDNYNYIGENYCESKNPNDYLIYEYKSIIKDNFFNLQTKFYRILEKIKFNSVCIFDDLIFDVELCTTHYTFLFTFININNIFYIESYLLPDNVLPFEVSPTTIILCKPVTLIDKYRISDFCKKLNTFEQFEWKSVL